MSGPWEDFQDQDGPWNDFQGYTARPSMAQYVSSFARPALETAGMVGGGILGGGVGIPTGLGALATGAVGAGLGYAAGRQAANILDETLGVRETPPLGQQLGETASDVQEGALGQMVGFAAGPVISRVGNALKPSFPTKIASTVLGPSTEAIEARLANQPKIAGASSYASQSESIPKTLEAVKGKITKAYEVAKASLRQSASPEEGAIAKSQIQGVLDEIKSNLNIKGSVVGQAEKGAASNLESLAKDIDNILKPPKPSVQLVGPSGQPIQVAKAESYIPETDIKRVIQAIDKNINWEDKGASATNEALTNARGKLDALLKNQNPSYAKLMRPVSQLERLYNDSRKTFSITNRTGEGLAPTDATISKVQSLPQERRSVSQGVAKRLRAVTGRDLIEESKTYGLAKQFEGGATQGSRRVNLGGMIGTAVGTAIGAATGSPFIGGNLGLLTGGLTGAYLDKAGGKIAGQLIDRYLASSVSRVSAPRLGNSTRALISAYVARRQSQ